MQFKEGIITAKFINRPNRFQAYVELNEQVLMVHVPNTGRCKEILLPGSTVILREGINPGRKTPYDLIAAYKGNTLINIDSQVPNKVVEEALRNRKIKKLSVYSNIEREKTFGNSRIDFRLSCPGEYYLEVKGVTFEENGIAMFPDAPTERGTKHLNELIKIREQGMGAGVLFLIQIKGIRYFTSYDKMDKAFGDALKLAKSKGVDIFAYNCDVFEKSISLDEEVDVLL